MNVGVFGSLASCKQLPFEFSILTAGVGDTFTLPLYDGGQAA
jgi:hypothetical protein